MSKLRAVLAAILLSAIVGVTSLVLLRYADRSALARYDDIGDGMTLEQVQQVVGETGSKTHPGGTSSIYLFDSKKHYSSRQPGSQARAVWYWKFDDGLIVCDFDPDGSIISKSYFRRTK